jgi:glutamyl/glutaminyl-tRNA synthetase
VFNYQKTRIAPTPSGFLHIGNILSFAITEALAQRYQAKVLLRIDDLDRVRVLTEYVQDIFDTLRFMGMEWQEGPRNATDYETAYSQTHRLPLYQQALAQLADSGTVFACTCSRSMRGEHNTYPGTCRDKGIPLDTPDVAWRLRTDLTTPLTVQTLNGTVQAYLPPDMQDFVIRRKNGSPAYQLSSLVDDVFFGVDLIVRGEDLWASTLAQLYLAGVLKQDSFLRSTFHHHQLIHDETDEKLSKSAGATSIQHLRKAGVSREDVYRVISETIGAGKAAANWEELGKMLL